MLGAIIKQNLDHQQFRVNWRRRSGKFIIDFIGWNV